VRGGVVQESNAATSSSMVALSAVDICAAVYFRVSMLNARS
jgi:hypothetical protein